MTLLILLKATRIRLENIFIIGNAFYREHILQRTHSTENTFYTMDDFADFAEGDTDKVREHILQRTHSVGSAFYREHILQRTHSTERTHSTLHTYLAGFAYILG